MKKLMLLLLVFTTTLLFSQKEDFIVDEFEWENMETYVDLCNKTRSTYELSSEQKRKIDSINETLITHRVVYVHREKSRDGELSVIAYTLLSDEEFNFMMDNTYSNKNNSKDYIRLVIYNMQPKVKNIKSMTLNQLLILDELYGKERVLDTHMDYDDDGNFVEHKSEPITIPPTLSDKR